MRPELSQRPSLNGFAPLRLEVFLSDYDIEMDGSLMVSGVSSRFRFTNLDGTKIDLPRTDDKVLAFSFFIDHGDEWQDVIDKLSHFKLINPKTGRINSKLSRSPFWREKSGLTPARYEQLAKFVEDGARPTGSIRRRTLAKGECISLGLTFKGNDEKQGQNYSQLFFAGLQSSRYVKVVISDIYFSMVDNSEAPTIAAFEKDSAPIFLFSEPKVSLHHR